MGQAIWKWELNVRDGVTEIAVPKGANFLKRVHCARHDQVWVWALVDPDAEKVPVKLVVVGTGHPLNHHVKFGAHIGSDIWEDKTGLGHLVWHVFGVADGTDQ